MAAISRRTLLASGLAATVAPGLRSTAGAKPPATPWQFALNTSTVRLPEGAWGKARPIADVITIAQKAGYTGIEPWISDLDEYVKTGGTLKELGTRFRDAGLAVPDAIGFAEWIVQDDARRKKGLEQAKRDLEKVQQIGGQRLAAPPSGATGGTSRRDDPQHTQPVDLLAAADRYRELFDLAKSFGITPIAEIWGFSKTLSRLGEAAFIACEGGRAGGILPDVYHLYKGGSPFEGLGILAGSAIGIFHVNDFPAIARPTIADADRVYPGDGKAPWPEIVAHLRRMNYSGFLSLELFNTSYWKQDPQTVAQTGLTKLKAIFV
ncbi:MAG: sugar phosphate isomerase/epimerase family protein [Gemmataceae bacterium]